MKNSLTIADDKVENNPKKHSVTNLFSWAIILWKPYWKFIVIILLAMILEALVGLAVPWPLKLIIDNVIAHQPLPDFLHWMDSFFPSENYTQLAIVAALSYLTITCIGSFASYLDSFYNEKVAQYVADDLRRKMYHHLQHLSLSYYDTHQTGKLISTLTADVATIQNFTSGTLLNILVDFLTIAGMVGVMFYLDSDFTLVALAVAPFLLFFVSHFKKAMKKATREVRKDQANMFVILQKGLESIRVVNAFGRQNYEEARLKKISEDTVDAALKAKRVKSVLSPVVAITVSACTAFVLWRGAHLVINGIMTVGTLTIFLYYMGKFFSPVQDLAKMTSTIAQVGVAVERIQAILKTDTITKEIPNAIKPQKIKGEIVFDHVIFFYDPESPVIQELNLTIHAGQRIGICGPTGSGKSTIVGLIARFYDPVSGRILIDGTDISQFTLDGLREQIAFVMQETILFYGSIRENIAYGKPDATEEEITQAAVMANAMEFIEKMPHKFETLVGENGVTLSSGQKQRIGIARALVRNSPILILDEPTSSLDTESEKTVMEALENLMKERTVIIIAHRLNTIKNVEKIIVLANGKIAEEGTHDELIKKGELYEELYNVQG
jgi:subfamily B ATP-binding cassette protein MsbA